MSECQNTGQDEIIKSENLPKLQTVKNPSEKDGHQCTHRNKQNRVPTAQNFYLEGNQD